MPKCCAPPAEGDQLVLQDCFPHVLRMVTQLHINSPISMCYVQFWAFDKISNLVGGLSHATKSPSRCADRIPIPLAGDPGLASLASKLSQLVTWKNTVDDHWIWGIHGESMGNMVIHHIPHYMIIKIYLMIKFMDFYGLLII